MIKSQTSSKRSEGRPRRRRSRCTGPAGVGAAGPGAGRDARAVHRPARNLPGPGRRPPSARHPQDRRSVHAEGSVLHDPALRPSGGRSGGVPAEGLRAGRQAAVALARRRCAACGSTELVAGFECSGNRRPLQGLSSNGRWTGVPLRDRARSGRREGGGARVRLLRRRSRRGGSRVPHAEVQGRSAVRPQPVAREGAVAGAVPRLRAERRAADASTRARRCGCSCRAGTASPT